VTGVTPPTPATAGASGATPSAAAVPTGNIYDLGYRRYEGPRLGRAHAIRTLTIDSFRTSFGIGRGGRAKIGPAILGLFAILPAVIVVGALAITSQLGGRGRVENLIPLGYDTYYRAIAAIIALFCAAEAPELFARDQRHGVIALYFARALRRTDYALARIVGFALALLVLLLVPMAILLVGRVLLSTDVVGAFGVDLPKLPAVVAEAVLVAGLFGSLAMAVSAYTPRRAYAVAATVALLFLPGIVGDIVIGLGSGGVGTWLVLLSPTRILDGLSALLFAKPLPESMFFFDLPVWAFLVSDLVVTLVAAGLAIRRFARMAV
jgi:ABC-2 type transport system permease protein